MCFAPGLGTKVSFAATDSEASHLHLAKATSLMTNCPALNIRESANGRDTGLLMTPEDLSWANLCLEVSSIARTAGKQMKGTAALPKCTAEIVTINSVSTVCAHIQTNAGACAHRVFASLCDLCAYHRQSNQSRW